MGVSENREITLKSHGLSACSFWNGRNWGVIPNWIVMNPKLQTSRRWHPRHRTCAGNGASLATTRIFWAMVSETQGSTCAMVTSWISIHKYTTLHCIIKRSCINLYKDSILGPGLTPSLRCQAAGRRCRSNSKCPDPTAPALSQR